MDIAKTKLTDVFLITPRRFEDARGFFSESWNQKTLLNAGLDLPAFVQDMVRICGGCDWRGWYVVG